ncbi:MAG TPA: hypothetical protein VFV32_02730 [Acidimicrobiales bacterium]|jgi:hypothetical protein|nr:hypothetical protein [Acidimicrobiales bacterium]
MPTALVPAATGAIVLLVPPLRHRAATMAKVSVAIALGLATVTARGARDLARAAVTGREGQVGGQG